MASLKVVSRAASSQASVQVVFAQDPGRKRTGCQALGQRTYTDGVTQAHTCPHILEGRWKPRDAVMGLSWWITCPTACSVASSISGGWTSFKSPEQPLALCPQLICVTWYYVTDLTPQKWFTDCKKRLRMVFSYFCRVIMREMNNSTQVVDGFTNVHDHRCKETLLRCLLHMTTGILNFLNIQEKCKTQSSSCISRNDYDHLL